MTLDALVGPDLDPKAIERLAKIERIVAARELEILEECCRGIEVTFVRGLGKWRTRGVPHKGWTCTHVYDVYDDDDELKTCEMCEHAAIRYVHVMRHQDYEGELEVGEICAGTWKRILSHRDGARRSSSGEGGREWPGR
jgi:hypothetical protein